MLQSLNRLDARFSSRFRLHPSHPLWKPAVALAHSGDSWLWAAGVGLIWLLSFDLPALHRTAFILEVSIIFQALFVFALKSVIRRQRPAGAWGGIYRQFDPHSFPSGHATRAALLAALALGLGPPWFAAVMLVWAPLVCASRVLTGLHYLTDILGGVLLGLAMGVIVVLLSPTLWTI